MKLPDLSANLTSADVANIEAPELLEQSGRGGPNSYQPASLQGERSVMDSNSRSGSEPSDPDPHRRRSGTWRRVCAVVLALIARSQDRGAGMPRAMPSLVAGLFADRELADRLHRTIRLVVVGAVLVVAMPSSVLMVHPEVLTALVTAR
jgi:hypothetical protein